MYHRIIISLCLLSVLATTYAGQLNYPLTPITNKVHVIYGPLDEPNKQNQGFRNNVVIIQTSKGIVLFDPGGSASAGSMVVRKVKSLANKPIVAVFNSHVHGDHWLGNESIKKAFPKAVIYGHPKMKKRVEGADGAQWLDMINRLTKGKANGTLIIAPDKVVNNGDVITIGDTRFRIHHLGPAHTDNDIMIEIVDQKILFTGDVVRNKLIGVMESDSSFKGNIATIDMAIAKKFNTYIPGHGQAGNFSMPAKYRDYLYILRNTVKDLYAKGMADFEMKPLVLKKASKYKKWPGFEKRTGSLISRAYLEVEAEDFQ